jgi:hypothetical protein
MLRLSMRKAERLEKRRFPDGPPAANRLAFQGFVSA